MRLGLLGVLYILKCHDVSISSNLVLPDMTNAADVIVTMMTSSNGNIFLLRYWPFVRGIYRSPVNSPRKGQWRGVLIFSFICAWINGWVSRTQDSGLKLFIQQQNTWEYTKEMKSYVEQLLHYMVWHRCIKHSSKHSFSLWLIHVRRLPLRLKINRLHGSHHKSKGQGFKDMLSYLVLVKATINNTFPMTYSLALSDELRVWYYIFMSRNSQRVQTSYFKQLFTWSYIQGVKQWRGRNNSIHHIQIILGFKR